MDRIRNILKQSPTGQHALKVMDDNNIKPKFEAGNNGEFRMADAAHGQPSNEVSLGPASKDDLQSALTLVHEMNHAEADLGGTAANAATQTRPDYINTNLAEDAHGERLAEQTLNELKGAGGAPMNAKYGSMTHPYFRQGMIDQATKDSTSNWNQRLNAGEQNLLSKYKDGTITTGNTGQTYVDYWGGAWDRAHPAAGAAGS
jgi:hypothetical protein